MARTVDWAKVKEWDEQYLVHAMAAQGEYKTIYIEHTEGDYLITPEGRRLLDFANQLNCVNAGQNVPEIQEEIREALNRYGFLWDVFTTDYKAEVAKILIKDILKNSGWASRVRFCLGGSDAVETALHLARLYSGKTLIATRLYGYHGVSSGAVQLTRLNPSRGHATDKGQKRDMVPGSNYANTFICPAPFCYRCPLQHQYPACKEVNPTGQLPCVRLTEETIVNHGVDYVAAIITEPAFGAGTIIPPKEYLPQIEEMKNRLGILWIVDEVLMGFGRLGQWFGYQAMSDRQLKPDMITVAKGITSSALPLGAVIVSHEISAYLENIRWQHVSTFSGHPLPLAAARANLLYMITNDVPAQARRAGDYFRLGLQRLYEKHPSIGFIAGEGMFWQIELVKNRETREAFFPEDRNVMVSGDTSKWPSKIVYRRALEKDVIISGLTPNTLRLAASCTVSRADMDKGLEALDYALIEVDEML
jgi:taurine--2-oxoglutarate transaminase